MRAGGLMHGLERRVEKLSAIVDVARAMTEERSLDRLLELIVSSATQIVEAERTTIFIHDVDRNELWSRVAEGTGEIRLPADAGLAGAVVTTGETINIPDAYADERFNRQVDQRTGFHTKSLLSVPMRNTRGESVGVLQTLNKTDGATFSRDDEALLLALAGVAAAALTTARLHDEIERLFEGFASASVVAIESRDPTTAGHSGRVAAMSVTLARHLDRSPGHRAMGHEELRELRYAALLHDFGKIGVREAVLVKAEKLYPDDVASVEQRFETIRRTLQLASAHRQLDLAMQGAPDAKARIESEQQALDAQLAALETDLALIRRANVPTVLAEGNFAALQAIAARRFLLTSGESRPYLTDRELRLLSIRRGSLDDDEREEIESHVTHTWRFLSQIPWTRSLRRVPEIAYGHHEKLSGHGYPRALTETSIPVQTRIITISDIYDALTAADRPYKRALSHERALDILHAEAKDGNVDAALLKIFVEADVAARALKAG